MSVVEQYARAHIVTDEAQDPPAVPVALRYDPEADPRRVRVVLPGRHEWVFARDLLEQGLRDPAAAGDVRIWPCGRAQAVMEFRSARGVVVVQFDTRTLIRFLRRTYTATPVAG
ncbi:SsgA family sporulation/cell division regulator [Streptomyces beigongshangae]|uniref:SsgA family sporulation/cell division regulator n=1 Tax=Streptomyces beigongshangae TaxID=2841597 RepID=UPI001C8564B0|nr:SsgA family sporulation/cell division regulator [Streptomyces sp. REN17]